jgi:hypothetical protein
MKIRLTYSLGALALLLAACQGERPGPGPQAALNQPAAGATGSETAYRGPLPNISPDAPAYAENGAPRAGQPSGQSTAGARSPFGNYAPMQGEQSSGGGI